MPGSPRAALRCASSSIRRILGASAHTYSCARRPSPDSPASRSATLHRRTKCSTRSLPPSPWPSDMRSPGMVTLPRMTWASARTIPSGSTSKSLALAMVYPASCRLSSAAITPQILASVPSPCLAASLAVAVEEVAVVVLLGGPAAEPAGPGEGAAAGGVADALGADSTGVSSGSMFSSTHPLSDRIASTCSRGTVVSVSVSSTTEATTVVAADAIHLAATPGLL
nr:unnamed protein product [Digitaria exilis]